MKLDIGKKKKKVVGGCNPFDPATAHLMVETESESRVFRRMIMVAAIFHLILLAVTFPSFRKDTIHRVGQSRKTFVVETVRFKKPPPKTERKAPKKETRKIPIPDPTPDDPEPIIEPEIEFELSLDSLEIDGLVGIPDGPPTKGSDGDGPYEVAGDVKAPVKLVYPRPPYTEEARRARVEGVVILETVIDRDGLVTEANVLKGLPHGLSESALSTIREWKFKPAMLEGEPVPVYFMLTVNFRIQ